LCIFNVTVLLIAPEVLQSPTFVSRL